MIDGELEYTPPSSIDDEHRKELLWERREEIVINKWCEDCVIKSVYHHKKGKYNKILYSLFGIPPIIIPIVLGGVSSLIPCHSLLYSVGMMCVGILSGVSVFFNFGKKAQEHSEYENRFFELGNEMETELCKPKRHRVACDVYLERTKQIYHKYCSLAPTF